MPTCSPDSSTLVGKPAHPQKERRSYRLPGGLTLEVNCVDTGLPTAFWYAEVGVQDRGPGPRLGPRRLSAWGTTSSDECTGKPGSSMGDYWQQDPGEAFPQGGRLNLLYL